MKKYDYDQIQPGYYDKVHQRNKGVQSRWHHHKFEMLSKSMPTKGKVLDIGCGPGTFVGSLKSQNPQLNCVGIDFSKQQIQYARQAYPQAEFHCIDIYDRNIEPDFLQAFDTIAIIEVIEHIDRSEAIAMLKRTRELIKTSGKLVLTTPNYHSLWGSVERLVNFFGEVNYQDQHINKYCSSRLRIDLEEAGFKNIRINSFLSFSPFLAAVSWRLSKIASLGECYSGILRPAGMLLIAEATP